jgi:hypothetical protein
LGVLREALEEACQTAAVAEQATIRLALATTIARQGRQEEARSLVGDALALVAGGRVPMIELQALQLERRLSRATRGDAHDLQEARQGGESRIWELVDLLRGPHELHAIWARSPTGRPA